MDPLLTLEYKTSLQLCVVNQWHVTSEYELSPSKWIPVLTVPQSRTKSSLPQVLEAPPQLPSFAVCPELYSHFHYGCLTKHSKWGLWAWKMCYFTALCSCSSKLCFERTGGMCQKRQQTNFKNNWGRYSTCSHDLCQYCSFSLFHIVFNEEWDKWSAAQELRCFLELLGFNVNA